MKGKILIVGDSESGQRHLADIFSSTGFSTTTSRPGDSCLDLLKQDSSLDVVFVDQSSNDTFGLRLLELAKGLSMPVQVVIVSESTLMEDANEAMRLGAFEVVEKPVNKDKALMVAELAVRMAQLTKENYRLKSRLKQKISISSLVSECREMTEAKEKARAIAPLDTPAMIIGEPGSGRRILAEAIHNESSRANGPFVCAILSQLGEEDQVERSLFGHEREAPLQGIMEKAEDGTLYLCDVSQLSLRLQSALLGVMQRGEFFRVGGYEPVKAGFRMIVGSGRNLDEEVRAGRFREELFFRLNVAPLEIPPLRKRKEDIAALAKTFLKNSCQRHGRTSCAISADAMAALSKYRWPGNVRELEDTIDCMVAQKNSGDVTFADLPDRIYKEARRPSRISRHEISVQSFAEEKKEFERQYLMRALEECEGNITVMARITDLSRPALYEKLKKHGLK